MACRSVLSSQVLGRLFQVYLKIFALLIRHRNVERGAPKGRAVITPGDLQKVTGGFVPSARASESTTESVLAFRLGVQVGNIL